MTRFRVLAAALVMFAAAAFLLAGSVMADAVDPAIGVRGGGGGSTLWGNGSGAGSLTVLFVPFITPGVTCNLSGMCNYTTPSNNPFFITSGSITDFRFSFNQSQFVGFSKAAGDVFPTLTPVNGVGTPNPVAFLSGGMILPAPILFSAFATTTPTIVGDFLLTAQGVRLGTIMTITSNVPLPVPEPTSVVLMLTGLGAFGVRKLRGERKGRNTAPRLGV